MTASIAIEKLENRRIGPFSLNSLFADFPLRQARKGDTLIQRNHSLGYVFYLTDGMVKAINFHKEKNKEVVKGYFTAGEMMNLEILNKNLEYSDTLKVTSTKAAYKIIPIQAFKELVRSNQGLNQLVMSTILDKMSKTNDRLQRLLLFKSRQRVVHFLLDYVAEVGQRVGYEYVIKKPFTHEEIGNLSDTSRQTVTTVLNELKAKNIIHFTRRYIVIRNMEELTNEAALER